MEIKNIYTGSIKKRLRWLIVAVVFFTGLIGYSIFIFWYMSNQQQKTVELSKSVGLVLSQDLAKLVLLNDVSVASDLTSKLKSFEQLTSMVLYNKENVPVYQFSQNNLSFEPLKISNLDVSKILVKDNILQLFVDAQYQNIKLGTLFLEFEIYSLIDILKRDISILIFLSILMLSISYLLAEIFSKRFTAPILKLVSFLETIELDDSLQKTIYTNEDNEFGKLYNEVNIMLHRIYNAQKDQKLASVAFETQSGMTITDPNQKILRVNRAFTQITGYNLDDVIGQTPSILKSGFQDKEFYKELWETLKTKHYWSGEVYNKHKDGHIYPEHLTIQAVLDGNNEVIYYVGTFIDLSIIKNQERALKEKESILLQQSKMASMGEMLENIAHQWRQPLSMITTSSSGLKLQKELSILSDEDLISSLENITNSATHLSQTIDDFRTFFKNDKIKAEYHIQETISKALMLLQSKLKNRNIEINILGEDIKIIGFKNEIIQVLMNILNNACDALEDSKTNDRLIIISVSQFDQCANISIQDNAGGIPNNILPHIFNHKFTTKGEKDGTGIGLYMSREIVKKVGGKIEVENKNFIYNNKEFRGALFEVILPLTSDPHF